MPLRNRAELKSYFETGDFPTQAQFEDLIDSLLHRTDNIDGNNVVVGDERLPTYLNRFFGDFLPTVVVLDNTDGLFELPMFSCLRALAFRPSVNMEVSLGYDVGDNSIGTFTLEANKTFWVDLRIPNNDDTQRTDIHITGVIGGILQTAVYFNSNPF